MALTVAKLSGREHPEGDGAGWRTVRKVTHDASYAGSGGEALTHEQLGFSKAPDWVRVTPYSVEAAGYQHVYDIANEKLAAYFGDYSNGSDGPFVEASGDLSSVVVIVEAYGRHAA